MIVARINVVCHRLVGGLKSGVEIVSEQLGHGGVAGVLVDLYRATDGIYKVDG
jgi:hypothetical protein